MKLFRLLLISLVVFASCKEKEKPVTRQEAQAFANSLEKSILKRETDFFDNAFSISGITKIVEDSLKEKYSKNELSGMKDGFRNKLKMGTQLVAVMSEGATYQLVRIYENEEGQHVIFRLYDDGKLNYHDMKMVHEKSEVKIKDMFIYASGENLSETLIAFFNGMMSQDESEALNNLDKVKSIRELITRNKNREALAEIDDLPEKMRNARPVQLLRMNAAMALDDDNDSTYIKVIDEFNAIFPDNGKMALMLLDGYVLHKEYDKALACVNQLDSLINKDPLLDFYRAMCFKLKKDEATARTCLEKLNTNMPTFIDGAVELAYNYCSTKEWEKAGALLNKIKKYKGFKPETLTYVKILYPEVEKYLVN